MPYDAEISRNNPTCFLLMIDQSGSMSDGFAGQTDRSKAQQLADIINRLLADICLRCVKNPSEGVRDYFYVGVIGYGRNDSAYPALAGPLAGQQLVRVSELANNPLRVEQRAIQVEDGAGGLMQRTVRFPIWFEPLADNGTPMCQAFQMAYDILQDWTKRYPRSFPPVVFNITDGQPTDGDPLPDSQRLQQLATSDGNVLVFNIHVSETAGQPLLYPEREDLLPDDYARLLFRMSSVLPPHLVTFLREEGFTITPQSRGFVFNANAVEVIRFLNIGTRPKNLR
ncbi:hypothetical protein HRbin36_00831 [bacterium HR36]|nr:hypothetical protein HRbin36_00831 [bacterium HR36]